MANKSLIIQGGDGTAIPAGMVGEVITGSAMVSTVASAASGTTVSTLTLTPGVWRIEYSLTAYFTTGNVSANSGYMRCWINLGAGVTSGVGKSERIVGAITRTAATNSVDTCLSACAYVIVPAGSTQVYEVRIFLVNSAGTNTGGIEISSTNYDGVFFAERKA